MFSYVNLNDPLNAKKIMSCKIKPVWAIWYMATQNAILKNGDVSIKSIMSQLLLTLDLDTGPFNPWPDMQIMLFAYSKILMQS